jgi:hypothetical protein
METEVVMLQSPNSSGSGSHSGSDIGSRHGAKLAARRAIKESRRSVWSSALATMTYLTNLAQAGGIVHACYLEDNDVPVAKIPAPEDHSEFSRSESGSMIEADEAPSESRVALALELFETSIGPMVTDYKLKRSMSAAMSVWNMSIADACRLDGAGLMSAFEHSVALTMAFSAMQDVRCGSKYAQQMENLMRIVFFPRELHMLLQYADKMAHLLIHMLMFYSGDDKVGRRQTIVILAYQIISLHRPFISQSSMHRIFMTMMTYAANHRDRQSWMAEAMNCEATSEFNEVLYFKHAFHIFYVFCCIHPRMSYEMPRPNYGFKELFGFLQILEYAALKLGAQDNEYAALANAFPDIALSFHLFIHGTRAECLFLLGDHALALKLAQWVIECSEFLENPNWQLLFALQSSLEICFVMKQLDWVYRAVHLLGLHSAKLPLAVTFNERNQKILNIHLPASVAQQLQKANEERLAAEGGAGGNTDRSKRAQKHWRDITQSTPPLEHVQADLDVNAVILKEPTSIDEHPTDPLCISNMLARSVLDGTIAATMAHQLGIKSLRDETMIPPVSRRAMSTGDDVNGKATSSSSPSTGSKAGGHGGAKAAGNGSSSAVAVAASSRARPSSHSDIDDEDVQALLSIGNLLETVEDDTLNTELKMDGVYSHGKSRSGVNTSSSSFSSPQSPARFSPASPARHSNSSGPSSPVPPPQSSSSSSPVYHSPAGPTTPFNGGMNLGSQPLSSASLSSLSHLYPEPTNPHPIQGSNHRSNSTPSNNSNNSSNNKNSRDHSSNGGHSMHGSALHGQSSAGSGVYPDFARLLSTPPAFVTSPVHQPSSLGTSAVSTRASPSAAASMSSAAAGVGNEQMGDYRREAKRGSDSVTPKPTSAPSSASATTGKASPSPSKVQASASANRSPPSGSYFDVPTDPSLVAKLGMPSILPTTLPPGFPNLSPLFPSQINPSQLTPSHLTGAAPNTTPLGSLALPVINSYLLPAPYILRPPTASSTFNGTSPLNPAQNPPNPLVGMLGQLPPSAMSAFPNHMGGFATPAFVTGNGGGGFPTYPPAYQPPTIHAGNMPVEATTAPFTTRNIPGNPKDVNPMMFLPPEFQTDQRMLSNPTQLPPNFSSSPIALTRAGSLSNIADTERPTAPVISLLNTTSGTIDLSSVVPSSKPNPSSSHHMNVDGN